MRKISLFAGVAALFLIGVGAWIGSGTWTSTSALAASTIDPFAMMVSAKDLPTSHYVDYSVVFNRGSNRSRATTQKAPSNELGALFFGVHQQLRHVGRDTCAYVNIRN